MARYARELTVWSYGSFHLINQRSSSVSFRCSQGGSISSRFKWTTRNLREGLQRCKLMTNDPLIVLMEFINAKLDEQPSSSLKSLSMSIWKYWETELAMWLLHIRLDLVFNSMGSNSGLYKLKDARSMHESNNPRLSNPYWILDVSEAVRTIGMFPLVG